MDAILDITTSTVFLGTGDLSLSSRAATDAPDLQALTDKLCRAATDAAGIAVRNGGRRRGTPHAAAARRSRS